jgi:hypothetical protein
MTRLFQFVRLRVRLVLLILVLLAFSCVAASPLLAQAALSLVLLPSITAVGTDEESGPGSADGNRSELQQPEIPDHCFAPSLLAADSGSLIASFTSTEKS